MSLSSCGRSSSRYPVEIDPAELLVGGLEGIGRRVIARVRRLDRAALRLAQALAVLGDGCELRHAAATAGLEITEATRLATVLVRLEILAEDDPPRFIHPVVRDALEVSLGGDARDAAHRSAARLLHADQASGGQIAAHLAFVRPAGDEWVLARLDEAAEEAIENGTPKVAADLLNRALAEPPAASQRIGLLRRTARAEVRQGGKRRSFTWKKRCGCLPIRGSESRLRLRSLRRQHCSGGWTRWIPSSGGWQNSVTQIGRSPSDWKVNSLSAVFTTRGGRLAKSLSAVLARRSYPERRDLPSCH
jgi:hypothetical protein